MEEQLWQLVTNNLVGVFFGVLFYKMSTGSIDKNTQALNELKDYLRGKQ